MLKGILGSEEIEGILLDLCRKCI